MFLAVFICLSGITAFAQYGTQFDNRGFENWANFGSGADSNEPIHWHSGMSASGTFAGFLSQQINSSTTVRPGSSGTKSVKLWPVSVLGVTANGNMTNGRINAGSMSATGTGNYNYTQRSDNPLILFPTRWPFGYASVLKVLNKKPELVRSSMAMLISRAWLTDRSIPLTNWWLRQHSRSHAPAPLAAASPGVGFPFLS